MQCAQSTGKINVVMDRGILAQHTPLVGTSEVVMVEILRVLHPQGHDFWGCWQPFSTLTVSIIGGAAAPPAPPITTSLTHHNWNPKHTSLKLDRFVLWSMLCYTLRYLRLWPLMLTPGGAYIHTRNETWEARTVSHARKQEESYSSADTEREGRRRGL